MQENEELRAKQAAAEERSRKAEARQQADAHKQVFGRQLFNNRSLHPTLCCFALSEAGCNMPGMASMLAIHAHLFTSHCSRIDKTKPSFERMWYNDVKGCHPAGRQQGIPAAAV